MLSAVSFKCASFHPFSDIRCHPMVDDLEGELLSILCCPSVVLSSHGSESSILNALNSEHDTFVVRFNSFLSSVFTGCRSTSLISFGSCQCQFDPSCEVSVINKSFSFARSRSKVSNSANSCASLAASASKERHELLLLWLSLSDD